MEVFDQMFDDPMSQLDRIEAKLDKLLEKKKRKPRSSKVEYPEWFEEIWKVYPKRAGSNPKKRAFEAYNGRVYEAAGTGIHGDVFHKDILEGTQRYAAYCDATGITGTGYVMQAARFFGVNKEYENDWAIPKAAKQKAMMPSNDEDLAAFAVKHKLHEPGQAPMNIRSMAEYRQWIQERLI